VVAWWAAPDLWADDAPDPRRPTEAAALDRLHHQGRAATGAAARAFAKRICKADLRLCVTRPDLNAYARLVLLAQHFRLSPAHVADLLTMLYEEEP
jgi:hypothetical protein